MAHATDEYLSGILQEGSDPARALLQHLDRAVLNHVNKIIRADKDFVFSGFKQDSDVSIWKSSWRAVVREDAMVVEQRS